MTSAPGSNTSVSSPLVSVPVASLDDPSLEASVPVSPVVEELVVVDIDVDGFDEPSSLAAELVPLCSSQPSPVHGSPHAAGTVPMHTASATRAAFILDAEPMASPGSSVSSARRDGEDFRSPRAASDGIASDIARRALFSGRLARTSPQKSGGPKRRRGGRMRSVQ